ncbi:hypothetical protein CRD60_02175 [Bifidobacterium aemilianum]|uniref:Tryptophan-rich sensory protein n=2 Tax=Bifidobacterium aemilianum TaxID=2493120 RepID=A0A366K9K2_9BIFI|nr:hypothetical protein CRD60_02175 [Bifidobacterium aemilianum]
MRVEDLILWLAWALTLAFNAYSEMGKLGGMNNAEISGQVHSWFTPAGYAFSIWGLIYLGLAVWLFFFCKSPVGRKPVWHMPMSASGLVFVLSCLLNVAWLTVWHMELFVSSIVLIVSLSITVWSLYARDRIFTRQVTDWAPLSLYGSWLLVATLTNCWYVLLRAHQSWEGSVPVQSLVTLALLLALILVSYLMRRLLGDWMVGLVVLWSGIAIGVKLMGQSAPMAVAIIILTTLGAIVIYAPWKRILTKA